MKKGTMFFVLNFHLIETFFLQNLHINFSDVIVGTTRGGAHPEVQNEKIFYICLHYVYTLFFYLNK